MLANEIAFSKNFAENILYNVRGKANDPNPHKSAWHEARNLFTNDTEAAGHIMQATASSSDATKPVYHFSIDWDRSEERFLTKENSIESTDKVLQNIGLAEHQALYFWHVDADHPHLHVVVNRVHPETNLAWDMWKSKERLERATHEVAKEMGFMQVPGKHNELNYQPNHNKDAPQSREERATNEDLKPWRKEKVSEIKAEIGSAFYDATSWQDLEERLGDAGYDLRGKGQGLIVTDGHNYTQLSKFGKNVRLQNLEEKFGEKFSEHGERDPLTPKPENAPVENFEQHVEKLDEHIQEQVQSWDDMDTAPKERDSTTSTDTRVAELSIILNNIDRFEGNWNVQKSASSVLTSEAKTKRQEKYLEKSKELLRYHEQKSMELIFSVYKKPQATKENPTTEKLKEAIKYVQKQKEPRWKRILAALKWRKKKLQAAQKTRISEAKKKQNEKLQWRIYYRITKLREAQSRITSKEFELNQTKAETKTKRKAYEQNTATREHLLSRRKVLLASMPKEAILDSTLPWQEKKRLLSVWYAANEHNQTRDKSRDKDRDIER